MAGHHDKELLQKFEAEYKKILDYVIEDAHIIITTCTYSGATILKWHFKPNLMVVDKAGKAMDGDVIVPVTSYLPQMLILEGDIQQL
jgi:hypothetical protein